MSRQHELSECEWDTLISAKQLGHFIPETVRIFDIDSVTSVLEEFMEVITVLSGQNSSLSFVFNDHHQSYLAKINSSNGRTTLAQMTSIYIAGCIPSSALL